MNLDGNIVDMVSLGFAAVSPLVKPLRIAYLRWQSRLRPDQVDARLAQLPFVHRARIIVDVLNGASLVPFLLLIGSVFFTDLMDAMLRTNKVFLGVGGLMGTVFVLGEILRLDSTV